jgi:outer membrane protein
MTSIIRKSLLALAIFAFGAMTVQAQNKFGYVEFQELLPEMSEYKKANTEMEAYGKQLQDELKKMYSDYERKVEEYQKNQAKMADAIREMREKELKDMQTRIQEFQETAQENMRKKEQELLKPIIEKAKKAIADVAKEGGYTYIFDSSPGTPLLYKPEGDDVINLVRKKLSISDTPAPAKPAGSGAPKK